MTDLILLGAGGHAKDIIKNLEEYNLACRAQKRLKIIGCIDDTAAGKSRSLLGYEVFNSVKILQKKGFSGAALLCAVGDPYNKIRFLSKLSVKNPRLASFIHPTASVAANAVIGDGTAVFAGTIISSDCRIGDNVCLNYSCTVSHDCLVGDNTTVSPGVNIGGRVTIGKNVFLGINACCCNKISLGDWAVAGAGTVIIKNLPSHAVAVGNPHRIIGKRKENIPVI